MPDIEIAVAKTNKYASRESGDTVEVVERPHGGFSIVLADGQGSGRSAKSLSHLVTAKAVSLIKDGARDGTVARAAHDYLYTYRGGKVSATLLIISVDLATNTLVLSRNSHCPVLLWRGQEKELTRIDDPSSPIGIYPLTRPVLTELPFEACSYVIAYSDGLQEAGNRDGRTIDIPVTVSLCLEGGAATARLLADCLLAHALELEANRPADDMTAVVLSIFPSPPAESTQIVPQVRRMDVHIPV